MKKTVTVCDVCEAEGKSTRRYTVREGNRSVTQDLCQEHDAAFEALLPKALTKTSAKRAAPSRGRRRVKSLEEIEEAKR